MRGDSTVISQDRVGEADVTSDPRISVADNKGWFLVGRVAAALLNLLAEKTADRANYLPALTAFVSGDTPHSRSGFIGRNRSHGPACLGSERIPPGE